MIPLIHHRTYTVAVLTLLTLICVNLQSAEPLDRDGNGYPDVWEFLYDASDLNPSEDSDGDGVSNLDESVAGTDPNDAADFTVLAEQADTPGPGDRFFTFQSVAGKRYQLLETKNQIDFVPIGDPIIGDGTEKQIALDPSGAGVASTGVEHHLWADVTGTDLSALTSLASYPEEPNGAAQVDGFSAPLVVGSGFGGSLYGTITPPESGDYTFYVSSGGVAQLSFAAQDESLAPVASVSASQSDIGESEWTVYPNQQSSAIALAEGASYVVRLDYLNQVAGSHAQVAWSGPGIDGIEVIGNEYLVPRSIEGDGGVSGAVVLERDYDSAGQTDLISPDSRLADAPAGMSGQVEEFYKNKFSTLRDFDNSESLSDHVYFAFKLHAGSAHTKMAIDLRGNRVGPQMTIANRSASRKKIVMGGRGGRSSVLIDVGTSYQFEVMASIDTPFVYQLDGASYTVEPDRFDVLISTVDGAVVAHRRNLTFRHTGSNVVTGISKIRLGTNRRADLRMDDVYLSDGVIPGFGGISSNQSGINGDSQFSLEITDVDSDGDGIVDSAEQALAGVSNLLFFDDESVDGTVDLTSLDQVIEGGNAAQIALRTSDGAAFEVNYPLVGEDNGEVIFERTGFLNPVSVRFDVVSMAEAGGSEVSMVCDGECCRYSGSAGEEEAEATDYRFYDEEGNLVSNTLDFEIGQTSRTLTVVAVEDTEFEYPESVNILLSTSDQYTLGEATRACVQLIDAPDEPVNNLLFTGTYSRDGNAVGPVSSSGTVSVVLNGSRTRLTLTTSYDVDALSSNPNDAHYHKSNPGSTIGEQAGNIIYEITNTPGDVASGPYSVERLREGSINMYPWDLTESEGAISTHGGGLSRQVVIDSLLGQNDETPLYFNIHTENNQAGEIWAILSFTTGRVLPPSPPRYPVVGSDDFPQLSGADLEIDVRRFLNQATFGATEESVEELLTKIASERATNPDYHRVSAFSDWIDDQIAEPQNYLLDYEMAVEFQHFDVARYFDFADVAEGAPVLPAEWPTIVRPEGADPAHWHLSGPYPVSHGQVAILQKSNQVPGLVRGPTQETRLKTFWQLMINGGDQLRQKVGYSLQQIIVASTKGPLTGTDNHAVCNFQDQINTHAFSHYRNILGFANKSPVMGHWLSSFQNQKGIDLNGDGIEDVTPDENLARENMQLFSIGLFELWLDGSVRVTNQGIAVPTYDTPDIQNFARIITGQAWGVKNNKFTETWGGVPYNRIRKNTRFEIISPFGGIHRKAWKYPMKMFGPYHDVDDDNRPKTFAGTTIDNRHLAGNLEAWADADLEDALDWLAGKPGDGLPDYDMVNSHRSTPAFVTRRLIQRMVTSNPSPDYLHRASIAFADSEGNLEDTVRAILLDAEARNLDIENPRVGMKKSPLESFIQVIRAMRVYDLIPFREHENVPEFEGALGNLNYFKWFLTNYGYPEDQSESQERDFRYLLESPSEDVIQMRPFEQQSVFNFYLPDHASTGAVSAAGLVAPEMQLATETGVYINLNFNHHFINSTSVYGGLIGRHGYLHRRLNRLSTNVANSGAYLQFDFDGIVERFYPSSPPPATEDLSSEQLANLQLLDELDKLLMAGMMKRRYPVDPSDDDDPDTPEVDDSLMNPREIILDAITYHSSSNDPFDGYRDESERISRLKEALYLILASPEFQIKK